MLTIETLTIFILACFVGYYVVLKVTPALHAPLMSVTNAISSIIIVVALDAIVLNSIELTPSIWFCCIAVLLTMVNIVGGFILTKRMLSMFASKKKGTKND